mmetsp:Transcript_16779/g.28322  ORF Transcript_16779/g.28322 Transcript_16779/m.28322 type:complete len:540 (+) Transcript_16779:297-1916(+)
MVPKDAIPSCKETLLSESDEEVTQKTKPATCPSKVAFAFNEWLTMVWRFFMASFGAVFLAIGIVLFPLSYCIPRAAIDILFKGLFKIGYTIYVFTPLGRWIHLRMVRSRRKNHTPPHTVNIQPTALSTCDVVPVPILTDNYGYLIVDHATKQCAAVDPADPELFIQYIEQRKLTLTTILTTHQHHDHAGGNQLLKDAFPDVVVVGGKNDKCLGMTKAVGDGDRISIGNTQVQVVETPCHTKGHVVFVVYGPVPDSEGNAPVEKAEGLFSGDTLFIGGVGAFFHGNAADMDRALHHKLGFIPDAALVFAGHEYTVENTRFAKWLEPQNAEVALRAAWACNRRAYREATVPCALGDERKLNPFMRLRDPVFAAHTTMRLAESYNKPWWQCWQSRVETAETKYRLDEGNLMKSPEEEESTVAVSSISSLSMHTNPVADQTAPTKLSDAEALKVMMRLHKLQGLWSHSPENQRQIPPCCTIGTCAQRITCSGAPLKRRKTRRKEIKKQVVGGSKHYDKQDSTTLGSLLPTRQLDVPNEASNRV